MVRLGDPTFGVVLEAHSGLLEPSLVVPNGAAEGSALRDSEAGLTESVESDAADQHGWVGPVFGFLSNGNLEQTLGIRIASGTWPP